MLGILKRWWQSMNFRFCRTNAYLAHQRCDAVEAAEWDSRAAEWERQMLRDQINRRFAA